VNTLEFLDEYDVYERLLKTFILAIKRLTFVHANITESLVILILICLELGLK